MYRKKTPFVEAFQLTAAPGTWPQWAKDAREAGSITFFPGLQGSSGAVNVSGAEGRNMRADVGDWIVLDENAMLCVVKLDDFEASYEPVDG